MSCTVGSSDQYLKQWKQCCENKDHRFFCTVIETVAQLKPILSLKTLGNIKDNCLWRTFISGLLKKLIKLQKSALNELMLISRRMT